MRKLLASLALLSVATSSAFALEIHHGKLLKHKEWTTGNAKSASFVVQSKAEEAKFREKLKAKGMDPAMSQAFVYSQNMLAQGTIDDRTDVNGLHFMAVANNSAGTENYLITTSICASTSEHTADCSFYWDEIQLDAQGSAGVFILSSLQPYFYQSGNFSSDITSAIYKEEENGFIPVAFSGSEGIVQITDSANSKIKK